MGLTDTALAPEVPGVPVQVGYATAPGPDGRPWVRLELHLGLTATSLLVPEQTARELAELVSRQLLAGADQARRERIGLVLPGQPGTPDPAVLQQALRVAAGA